MEKNENVDFVLPDSWAASTPPGFPPQSLKARSSAAAGLSTNPNPSSKENEPVHGLNQTPRRRTCRKRSRPQFYAPSAPPKLAAAGRRCRGRPPKSGFISRLAHLKTVTSDGNGVSPVSKDQSSLQVNDNQVVEHGSHPSPHSLVGLKTNTKKKTSESRMNQRTSFCAHDIEDILVDISLTEVPNERARGVGHNNQISEGIDSKIWQHVANALQYMTGNQTAVADAKVMPRSSGFNPSLVHTLEAINKKHGDITRGCLLESDCMKTVVLLGICKVVQDLQRKQLKDLDINGLNSYYTAVRDAENMKVNVQWLRSRLDEIGDACKLSDGAKRLMDERDRQVGNIDETKKKLSQRRVDLERLQSEVQGIEEQLVQELVLVEELNKKFSNQLSKISRFRHANLMDGLI
ncbi:uncharacterized protein LOC130994760 [Salvia miltiorrhiza]|uniref:uncharacterized protein LOC130994760 n=1 Tax=Salvia miltiorrhiza TaxID=226208 RepID=UPI0025ABC7C5|nr:uncharacterized protein LOC130994760 [Salvia miltiorrhiza]